MGRERVAKFCLQPTKSYPDGAPQRESYYSDGAYLCACDAYDVEWRHKYKCQGCDDCCCPQCGKHAKIQRCPNSGVRLFMAASRIRQSGMR